MNNDFLDMLSMLSEEGAEYLLVGAYALAVHGLPRATGDLAIWIRTTPENRRRVWRALEHFGTPLHELEEEDLAADDLVFQIGLAPQRIDILTSIDGVDFEEAWPERFETAVAGQPVTVTSRAHLARNKRASGRPQDLADLAWLEKGKSEYAERARSGAVIGAERPAGAAPSSRR